MATRPRAAQRKTGAKRARIPTRSEPRAEPFTGDAPEDLTGEALEIWNVYTPQLQRLGLLSTLDVPIFRDLCVCSAEAFELERHVAEFGNVMESRIGGLAARPEVAMLNAKRILIMRYRQALGMSPAARKSIEVVPPKKNEPTLESWRKNQTA